MEEKSYLIYGIGKVQKDFEYIFDKKNIEGYIIDNEQVDIKVWNGRKVYTIKNIPGGKHIIICDFDKEKKANELQMQGYTYQVDFSYADDFFKELDLPIDKILSDRKLYVWGTGYQAHELMKLSNIQDKVFQFIDNDIDKNESIFYGRKVIHPTLMHIEENAFVIVATDSYFAIRHQLDELGLEEGKDYMWSRYLVNSPSVMLAKTMYDKAQYDLVCDTMFSTYEIESTGEVTCCCTTFINERIGNLIYQDFAEIWNSNMHKILCLSSANKTFSFCKKDMCPVLMNKIRKEYVDTYVETKKYKQIEEKPRVMLISIDSSCNLYCESCRNCVCVLQGIEREKANKMAEKLLSDDNFSNAEFIVMAGNGEVFLSNIYEKIWSSEKTKHAKRFRLLSNGTLFVPQRWNKFAEGRDSEVVVTFSIDAATAETYSQVRRGGNFEQLLKNLEFAAELRKEGKLGYFQINFVVQRKNYKEMPLFVELGKRLDVDKVFFTRILNWGTYSEAEFKKISMTDDDGYANEELQEILQLPIMSETIVDLGTINSKGSEEEYNYISNYYLWEIDRYLEKRGKNNA